MLFLVVGLLPLVLLSLILLVLAHCGSGDSEPGECPSELGSAEELVSMSRGGGLC